MQLIDAKKSGPLQRAFRLLDRVDFLLIDELDIFPTSARR